MLSNLLKEETTIEIVENENNKNWESINDYLINEKNIQILNFRYF